MRQSTSIRGSVRPSVRPSVGRSVGPLRLLISGGFGMLWSTAWPVLALVCSLVGYVEQSLHVLENRIVHGVTGISQVNCRHAGFDTYSRGGLDQ